MVLHAMPQRAREESSARQKPKSTTHHPPTRAHLGLFGGEKKSPQNKNFDDHPSHLTSINSQIDHHDNGNVLVTRELSDSLLAKIKWVILTPGRIGVPF